LKGCSLCNYLDCMYPGVSYYCKAKHTILTDRETTQINDCDRFSKK
jgi:hypothetical protein